MTVPAPQVPTIGDFSEWERLVGQRDALPQAPPQAQATQGPLLDQQLRGQFEADMARSTPAGAQHLTTYDPTLTPHGYPALGPWPAAAPYSDPSQSTNFSVAGGPPPMTMGQPAPPEPYYPPAMAQMAPVLPMQQMAPPGMDTRGPSAAPTYTGPVQHSTEPMQQLNPASTVPPARPPAPVPVPARPDTPPYASADVDYLTSFGTHAPYTDPAGGTGFASVAETGQTLGMPLSPETLADVQNLVNVGRAQEYTSPFTGPLGTTDAAPNPGYGALAGSGQSAPSPYPEDLAYNDPDTVTIPTPPGGFGPPLVPLADPGYQSFDQLMAQQQMVPTGQSPEDFLRELQAPTPTLADIVGPYAGERWANEMLHANMDPEVVRTMAAGIYSTLPRPLPTPNIGYAIAPTFPGDSPYIGSQIAEQNPTWNPPQPAPYTFDRMQQAYTGGNIR
jgi:hypothetical protein